MAQDTARKINTLKRIYEICLTALTIDVGLLFIVQVWALYSVGEKAFSRSSIANYFAPISPFVWLWLLAVVGAAVIWYIFPTSEKKCAAMISPKLTLTKLRGRLPQPLLTQSMQQSENGATECSASKKESVKRIVVWGFCTLLCIACAIVATVYLTGEYALKAQTGFFASHGEAERILRALPWVFGGIFACIGACYYDEYSVKQEITLVKTEIAENAKKGIKAQSAQKKRTWFEKVSDKIPFLKSKWFMVSVRGAIGVAAVVLIVMGIDNGGMADVLEKAINICTQCIGLG